MSITPLTFTGISQYSTDFQTILDRAVKIAQIPVQQLQNRDSDVLQRKALLGSFSLSVARLAADLKTLGDTASGRALSASTSDSASATATNTGATSAAVYTIDSITSAASAASERSLTGYADAQATPVSATGTVKLVVGGQSQNIILTHNNLASLRDQINGLNLGVNASILTAPTGNYLTVNANSTGATTLQLIDDPGGAASDLLTSTNPGTDAVFQLNGIDVRQSGNVVNSVIPGVSLTILKAANAPITVTLGSDRAKLQSALADFVTSFNGARDAVNGQIGAGAGLLSGDTVIGQVSDQLRRIAGHQLSSGAVKSLSDLGITFDLKGHASLDAAVFNALPDTAIAHAFNFVGSATSGLGGFSKALDQFGDPLTGLIHVEQDGLERTDRALQKQIGTLNDRITIMQNALAAKLHAADALLGRLASQQLQLTASLQGLNSVLYGKNPN